MHNKSKLPLKCLNSYSLDDDIAKFNTYIRTTVLSTSTTSAVALLMHLMETGIEKVFVVLFLAISLASK